MKRFTIFAVIATLVVVAGLAVTFGAVNAQNPNPPTGGGYGMMGQGMGVMHTYMQEAVAGKLGMTVEEYQQALADGKNFWTLAEEKGLTTEEAQALMTEARNEALDQAVAAEAITQEQADWMKERMSNMPAGGCHGDGTGRGGRMGGRGGMMGGRWSQQP